jgi:hypothetical protein
MTKKTSKIFSIFWLVTGLIWTFATIRHIAVNDDLVGAVIYLIAAIISFIIAVAFYKNFIK